MAKKSYNNYDDTLFGQYIRQIENADSAGWNASDRIWRAPQRKGLDKRNRGMGVDVLNNLDTKALTKNRPGQYLTEKEEHQLRNEHIQYLLDVINKRKEEDNPALKNMSPKKQAQVLGIMYRGDAPELWKENTILGKALISDKDEDMDKAIKDFYESKGLGERAKNDSIFWNNQKIQNKPKAAAVPQTHINNTVEYQDAIKTYRPAVMPSQIKRDTKKAMQGKVDFHNFMDSISIQNNLPPAYTPKSNIHSEGGYMYKPRDAWEALSMPEKAEMMKVAVRNGITNLQDIRQKYNEFAEGGNIYKEGGKKKSSSANPSAQRAMRYFMDKGLTDYQAAGLVGNLMRESGMNPQALNKGSKAYGLAQWLGPRKKALFARYGNNPTLENQLDFIWSELNSTHRNGLRHLRSSRSAEEAARNAMGYYEFSAGPEAAIANMRKYGQDGEGSMRKGISFASSLMGQPVPAYNPRQDEATQLSLQESAVPSEGFIYTPLNPQVFGIADTPSYTINVPDQTLAFEPQVEEFSVSLYSPEELDRQERMDKLSAFNNMLRMTSPQGNGNIFLDAIGMLTGNAFADGGGIHIKPENRGKFTALKERTGHSATWFKEHGTPAQKKMAIFELNARKWKHGYGGNLYGGITEPTQQMQVGKDYWTQLANKPTWLDTFITPLNGGQLSEVVVKPTNDESWLFSLGKYARNSRKPLADSHARKVVANYLSRFDNESAKDYNARISRLADALDIRGVQFIKNNVESGKLKNRAHYDTKSNTAYIDDMHDIFAEVAHPWQDAKGNNFMDDEFKKGNYDPDIDSRGGTRYAYPDTFEGETHGFFEPALTEWVETGKIGRSLPLLNEDLSNEKIVPKDNIEVLDSAASWNKQAIDKRVIANPHQLPLTKRIQYSIWDYPLLNKKKALGGNLYDGISQPSQQM